MSQKLPKDYGLDKLLVIMKKMVFGQQSNVLVCLVFGVQNDLSKSMVLMS